MKILIIGHGSIGRRHKEVLEHFEGIQSIHVVTKQNLENETTYKSLEEVDDIDQYDYYIIASETNKHYSHLEYLESKLSQKIIFCEKPLFETKKELPIQNNTVYVGYVLRFHPLLQKLKTLLTDEQTVYAHAYCGQYLPTWRTNIDYRQCYSAKKSEGGGVLLDLSHEIDYVQWLFGRINDIKSFQVKVSDLEIDSDDLTTLIGKTEKGTIVNVSIDYFSKITQRKLLVHTRENTYELNFIANKLVKKNKLGEETEFSITQFERNYMFEQMHKAIFENNQEICTYDQGVQVMETIFTVQEQNQW